MYNTPRFPDLENRLANLKGLDGGASIKVTGPNGTQNIALNGDDVTLAPGTFIAPGTYTFTGTGGANVGSIDASLTVPPPAVISGLTGGNLTVTRANGVTVNWTGGTVGSIVRVVGRHTTDASNAAGMSFRCYAAANANTLAIPPSVTLSIPAGNFGGWDFKNYSSGTFTATGFGLGNLEVTFDTPIFTTIQ